MSVAIIKRISILFCLAFSLSSFSSDCNGIKNGDQITRVRYEKNKVSFDETCAQEVQKSTCRNGRMTKWTGNFKQISCSFSAHINLNDSNEKKLLRTKRNKYSENEDQYIANEKQNHGEYSENLEELISEVESDRNISGSISTESLDTHASNEVQQVEVNSDHPLDVDFQNDEYDNEDGSEATDLEDI